MSKVLSDGRITRSGKYAHFCNEWDDMLIDENDPEFEACHCFSGDPEATVIREQWWKKQRKAQVWETNKAPVIQLVFIVICLACLYWIVVKID